MSKLSDFHSNKTHCVRGHALTEDNIKKLSDNSGHRVCKTCHRENSAKSRRMSKKNRITDIQRFWKKVIKTETCWLWTASTAGGKYSDYGVFSFAGQQGYAHRFSFEHFKGPIPEGHQIDHLCRIRKCVNPDHLDIVTQKENLMRGDTISKKNMIKTHCKYGHEFTRENTYFAGPNKNHRGCKHCRDLRNDCLKARMRKQEKSASP